MTTQSISILLPPYGSATLTLPEVLTPDAFARLDKAIGDALREPRPAASPAAARDPAAIEFDSWLPHQH